MVHIQSWLAKPESDIFFHSEAAQVTNKVALSGSALVHVHLRMSNDHTVRRQHRAVVQRSSAGLPTES